MVRPRGFRVEVSSVFGVFWSTIFVCAHGCARHGEYTAGGSSLPTASSATLIGSAVPAWNFSLDGLANQLALVLLLCASRESVTRQQRV